MRYATADFTLHPKPYTLSPMIILGIETSCDETAAAVVEDGCKLLSNVVASSIDLHKAYGGVVPEIAARSHIESIIPVIDKALRDACEENRNQKLENSKRSKLITNSKLLIPQSDDLWSQIDAIAVTQGPGLIGSLLIGVLTARTLAIAKNKPLYAVNHVAAHPYALFITKASSLLTTHYSLPTTAPKFPILALTVSGGHTQLVLLNDHSTGTTRRSQKLTNNTSTGRTRRLDQKLLGRSGDDAAGEAYDKVAKMLGLPYPGGPELAKLAKKGNPKVFDFPKAKLESPFDFSFSGLKTAVLRAAQRLAGQNYTFPSHKLSAVLNESQKANLAASFQRTVNETLVETLNKAEIKFQPKTIIISGGVAANQDLRKRANRLSTPVIYPDSKLCTDNAAMVATMVFYQRKAVDPYSLEPKPSL